MSTWLEIWNKRTADSEILSSNEIRKIFAELKRANGFDVINGGLSINALINQYEDIKQNFSLYFKDKDFSKIKSIYEIGCGSGANLFLFQQENKIVGGGDYSSSLIKIAKKILKSSDLQCIEAVDVPKMPKYDAVLSNSVFSYFPDYTYANTVLEKLFIKAQYVIGLIDIHDIEKKEDFINFRKANIEDYEIKYKDLNKLFYSKEYFIQFAKKHDMNIKFTKSKMEGYWNNEYVFNCYLYKREA